MTQFYRARFMDDVRVESGEPGGDERITMAGDELSAVFAFERETDREARATGPTAQAEIDAASPTERPRASRHADGREAAGAPTRQPPPDGVADGSPTAPPTPADSLMTYANDDVVVTWLGRMIVQPAGDDAVELGGPEDLLLAMTGTPVRVETARGESMTAAVADYLAPVGRLRASASADHPLVIESAELGRLAGQSLMFDQSADAGHVVGPGWLRARVDQAAGGDAAVTMDEETLEIAWLERLDLAFNPRTVDRPRGAGGEAATLPAIGTIRSAVFRGEVTLVHPQVELTGRTVTADFTGEADDAARTDSGDADDDAAVAGGLRRVLAEGDASLLARGQTPQDTLDLDGQRIDIGFERDEHGRTYPATLTADDRVVARQPDLVLETAHLRATMAPTVVAGDGEAHTPGADEAPAAAAEGAPRIAVQTLSAHAGVRVTMSDPVLQLTGDRMEMDQGHDQIDIFGSDADPARVEQPDFLLHGRHIVVHPDTQVVHVPTAGDLTLRDADDEAAGTLRVDWRQAMTFDNLAGRGEFLGNVVTTTQSPTDRTRLTTPRLDLELDPATSSGATRPSVVSDRTTAADTTDEPRPRRQVRIARAVGESTLDAETFESAAAPAATPATPAAEVQPAEASLLTRVRITGPAMTFDNRDGTERVSVDGAGRMYLLDQRPQEVPEQPTETAEMPEESRRPTTPAAAPAVAVTGRGDTLFLWQQSCSFTTGDNRMVMLGDVEMVHRPLDHQQTGEPPVTFRGDRLIADLDDSAGLADWTDRNTPRPDISRIEADGAVRIVRGPQSVTTDHMLYEADTGRVTLTADRGRLVNVVDRTQPVPISGGVVIWNLQTNTFDIRVPGPAVFPLQR
jgi:hypothetical protein